MWLGHHGGEDLKEAGWVSSWLTLSGEGLKEAGWVSPWLTFEWWGFKGRRLGLTMAHF